MDGVTAFGYRIDATKCIDQSLPRISRLHMFLNTLVNGIHVAVDKDALDYFWTCNDCGVLQNFLNVEEFQLGWVQSLGLTYDFKSVYDIHHNMANVSPHSEEGFFVLPRSLIERVSSS